MSIAPETERRRRALARMSRPPRARRSRDRRGDGPQLDVAALQAGQWQAGDAACGVVIGVYYHVELVELQLRALRFFCGDVPVLVSDDCSPGDRPNRMREICRRYGAYWLSPQHRRGHVAGDLATYAAGIRWAASLGLQVLAKISQRWICTLARWLQEGARTLLEGPYNLASAVQRLPVPWPLRSEAVLLDVPSWHRPALLAALDARPSHASAECSLDSAYRLHVGERRMHWALAGSGGRCVPVPGVLWHDNTCERDYRTLAGFFGVDLGREFNVLGSDFLPGYFL